MTRALLWKEFREQRHLVLTACLMALLLPLSLLVGLLAMAPSYTLHTLGGMLPVVLAIFVWPVIAAATGGLSVASDLSDESLRFLLTRPVSRARVWVIKVGVALAALALAVAGSLAIAFVFDFLISGGVPDYFWGELDRLRGYLSIGGPLLLLFVSAHYCSLFLRRPLAAALAGGALLAAMGASVFAAWVLYSGSGMIIDEPVAARFFQAGTVWGVGIAIAGLTLASFWVFRRAEVPAAGGARRMVVPLVVVALAVTVLGAVPASHASALWIAEVGAVRVGDLRVVDGEVVVPQLLARERTTALVVQSMRGDSARVLVPRNATAPARSVDGEWVVYVSYRMGARPAIASAHLRAVRIDGSDDHAISEDLREGWNYWLFGVTLSVAPDNDHVVYSGGFGSNTLVTSISGGPTAARALDLDRAGEAAGRRGDLVGWVAGRDAELLRSVGVDRYRQTGGGEVVTPGGNLLDWGEELNMTRLLATDVITGAERVVRDFAGSQRLAAYASGSVVGGFALPVWTRLPAWIGHESGGYLFLVDVASGEAIELSDSPCRTWGLGAGSDSLLYGRCGGSLEGGDQRAELRLRDLATGEETLFAVLENYDATFGSYEARLSPGQDRALLFTRDGFGAWGTYVVERGGTPRSVAPGRVPAAWDGERAVLTMRQTRPREFSVVDVDTGVVRVVFP